MWKTGHIGLRSRTRLVTNFCLFTRAHCLQRWLGVRLDFLGALLTFIVAIMAVGTRFTISPAQTGLVLSYILNVQQL